MATDPDVLTAAPELHEDEQATRQVELRGLIDLMRPSVQYDGGDLELIDADYTSGVVTVQLTGACSSCAISSATLAEGVTRILTTRLPWVTQVNGDVDQDVDPLASAAMGRGAYTPNF